MGVIEAFNEAIPDWVCNSLIAMTFLEVEPGAGEGVLDVVDNSDWDEVYALSMEGMSLGM